MPKLSRAGNRSSLTTVRLTVHLTSSVAPRTHEFAMSLNPTVGSRVWGARTTWPSGWRVGSMSRSWRETTSGHRTSSRGSSLHSRTRRSCSRGASRRRLIRRGRPGASLPGRAKVRRHQRKTAAQTVQLLLEENCIPACTVVCRTSALRAVGGFHQPEGIPNVDYPTWLELCRVGRFAPVNRIVGFYRRHDHQVSVTMTKEMLRNLDVGPAFVEALDVRERKALGVSVDSAWRSARRSWAAVGYAAGSVALKEGRRRVATAYFRSALREGGSGIRLRAMVGLASIYLGTDPDAIRVCTGTSGFAKKRLNWRRWNKPTRRRRWISDQITDRQCLVPRIASRGE